MCCQHADGLHALLGPRRWLHAAVPASPQPPRMCSLACVLAAHACMSCMRPRSAAVAGRRPFGKDVALDYEVMSDQDWEEEPEGESLSVSAACW